MMFRLTTIAALVGFVSANSYSIGCMNTLINLATDTNVANCLNPSALLPILVGAGNGPDSVIAPLDAWLTGICAQPACTSDVLNNVVNTLNAGCSAEFGLAQTQATLNMVTQNYATIRNAMCLKDSNSNCVTQTLSNMEAAWGKMNLNDQNVAAIVNGFKKGLPESVLCTDCMKGTYTVLEQGIPGTFTDSDKNYASQTCGAAFIDGGMPPSLLQSAFNPNNVDPSPAVSPVPTSTSTNYASLTAPPLTLSSSTARPSTTANPSRKNGALGGPSSNMNLAVSGLVVVFTGMAFL